MDVASPRETKKQTTKPKKTKWPARDTPKPGILISEQIEKRTARAVKALGRQSVECEDDEEHDDACANSLSTGGKLRQRNTQLNESARDSPGIDTAIGSWGEMKHYMTMEKDGYKEKYATTE